MFRTSINGETHWIAANCDGSYNLTTVHLPVRPPRYPANSNHKPRQSPPQRLKMHAVQGIRLIYSTLFMEYLLKNTNFLLKMLKTCLQSNDDQLIILYALAKSF